jgi:2-polyprenyl-3-methyl-5-hydroxy-6-metoxy-1,4-benzoquinol methylase
MTDRLPSVDPVKHPNVSIFEIDEEFIMDAEKIIQSADNVVPEYWKIKYERDNAKNWDSFYKNNQSNFFKDRHYISEEFGLRESFQEGESFHIIDFGCGVGNAIIPLMQDFPASTVTGFDCASSAIALLNKKLIEDGLDTRCGVSVGDLTNDNFPSNIHTGDVGLLFFVLSAIDPQHYLGIQKRVWGALKPGSALLFRDYGVYDMAQLRFEKSAMRQGNRISENFYVRGDGTRAKFFTEHELRELWESDGRFRTDHIVLHTKKIVNRKTGVEMKRVWIQAKWIRI